MKFIKSILVISTMILGVCASAQTETATSDSFISNAINGGYNQVNVSYVSQSFHTKFKAINMIGGASSGELEDLSGLYDASLQGFGIEYIRGFKVSKTKPMFVEAGATFNFTFGDVAGQSAQQFGLAIPISFAYKFNIKNKFSIKPYAGIDFKVGLLGRNKIGDDEDTEWFDWYDKENDEMGAYKRFNLGWHIGVDFQYRRYILGLNFVSDITKVYSGEFYKVKNPVIAIKLGYNF